MPRMDESELFALPGEEARVSDPDMYWNGSTMVRTNDDLVVDRRLGWTDSASEPGSRSVSRLNPEADSWYPTSSSIRGTGPIDPVRAGPSLGSNSVGPLEPNSNGSSTRRHRAWSERSSSEEHPWRKKLRGDLG